MKRTLAGVIAAWLLAGAAAVAEDFWNTKDAEDWSDKDVARILTDSPWAHRIDMLTANLSLSSRVGGLSGGVVGTGPGGAGRTPAGGGVAGDGAGTLGGGSFLAPPERTRLVVLWASAWPIRQAFARKRSPPDAESGLQPAPWDNDELYWITVSGLPVDPTTGSPAELRPKTRLKLKRSAASLPIRIAFGYEQSLLTIAFGFSRADALTPTDGEVEFSTRLGTSEIKTKFKLKDLVVNDRLAL
jgi:hypothetical protein